MKKPLMKSNIFNSIYININIILLFCRGVDDSEIMSEYSALSDFAYETAADIMKAYKTVFEC